MYTQADLNLLPVLDHLLRTQSVTRTAESLGITQAAVSNALRRLRTHFTDDLLVRQGREMVLTSRAKELLPAVTTVVSGAREVLRCDKSFDPGRASASVRIATSDHIDAVVIGPFLKRIAKVAPDLRFVVESFSRNAVERLTSGELQLIIAPRSNFPPHLLTTRLLEEPFAVVLREKHPLAGKKLSIREYAGLDHVLISPAGGQSSTIDHSLASINVPRKIVRQSAFFSYALMLVAEADLAATVPHSLALRYRRLLRLSVSSLPVSVPPVLIDLCWSKSSHRDPLNHWIRNELIRTARETTEHVSIAARRSTR